MSDNSRTSNRGPEACLDCIALNCHDLNTFDKYKIVQYRNV